MRNKIKRKRDLIDMSAKETWELMWPKVVYNWYYITYLSKIMQNAVLLSAIYFA